MDFFVHRSGDEKDYDGFLFICEIKDFYDFN